MPDLIRIERGAEVGPGIWEYSVPSLRLCGKSRQPLLDACREIKRTLGSTKASAGVFREGHSVPDIVCPVEAGALVTVSEPSKGNVKFSKYQPFDFGALRQPEEV